VALGRFSLPIGDCRLSIEKVAWRLLPLSVGNRQSKIGNCAGEMSKKQPKGERDYG
jgi:hypothetical protein